MLKRHKRHRLQLGALHSHDIGFCYVLRMIEWMDKHLYVHLVSAVQLSQHCEYDSDTNAIRYKQYNACNDVFRDRCQRRLAISGEWSGNSVHRRSSWWPSWKNAAG